MISLPKAIVRQYYLSSKLSFDTWLENRGSLSLPSEVALPRTGDLPVDETAEIEVFEDLAEIVNHVQKSSSFS